MEEGLFTVYRGTRGVDVAWDQAIRLRGDGVEIRAGRTGEVMSLTRLSEDNCWAKSPWSEMKWRRCQWVRDGFRLVGYGVYENDRLQMLHEAERVPQEAKPEDNRLALHWSATAMFAVQPLEAALIDIAKALRDEGAVAAAQSRYVEGRTGLAVELKNRTWTLRLQPTGELTEVGQQKSAARLLTADGTVPFLVLLRIDQVFPGSIEFIWMEQTDAWAVRPLLAWGDPHLWADAGPFEQTMSVARSLGLAPPLPVEGKDSDPAPVWF